MSAEVELAAMSAIRDEQGTPSPSMWGCQLAALFGVKPVAGTPQMGIRQPGEMDGSLRPRSPSSSRQAITSITAAAELARYAEHLLVRDLETGARIRSDRSDQIRSDQIVESIGSSDQSDQDQVFIDQIRSEASPTAQTETGERPWASEVARETAQPLAAPGGRGWLPPGPAVTAPGDVRGSTEDVAR